MSKKKKKKSKKKSKKKKTKNKKKAKKSKKKSKKSKKKSKKSKKKSKKKAKKGKKSKKKAKKSKKKSKKKAKKSKKKGKKEECKATGKRKSAVARVWLFSNGSGEITVNGKDIKDFFPNLKSQNLIFAPLKHLGKENDFDLKIKVKGGGFNGQAEATQLGIARALEKYEPEWRKKLKSKGFLSRDARVKERKKPGLKRARRAPQWRKR